MKKFPLFMLLCVVLFFLAKVVQYVLEYYDKTWSKLTIK